MSQGYGQSQGTTGGGTPPQQGYGMSVDPSMDMNSSYGGGAQTASAMGGGTPPQSFTPNQPFPTGDPPQQVTQVNPGGDYRPMDPMGWRHPMPGFPPRPTGPIPTQPQTGGGMPPQMGGPTTAPPTMGNPAMNPPAGVPTGQGSAWAALQNLRARFPGQYGG